MTLKEFLAAEAKPCKVCGNKIRPAKVNVQDMQASYDCPVLRCDYCDRSAGVFYPEEGQKCLDAWNAMN